MVIEALGLLTIDTFRAFFTSGPFIWHPAIRFLLVLGYAAFLREAHKRRATSSAAVVVAEGVEEGVR